MFFNHDGALIWARKEKPMLAITHNGRYFGVLRDHIAHDMAEKLCNKMGDIVILSNIDYYSEVADPMLEDDVATYYRNASEVLMVDETLTCREWDDLESGFFDVGDPETRLRNRMGKVYVGEMRWESEKCRRFHKRGYRRATRRIGKAETRLLAA